MSYHYCDHYCTHYLYIFFFIPFFFIHVYIVSQVYKLLYRLVPLELRLWNAREWNPIHWMDCEYGFGEWLELKAVLRSCIQFIWSILYIQKRFSTFYDTLWFLPTLWQWIVQFFLSMCLRWHHSSLRRSHHSPLPLYASHHHSLWFSASIQFVRLCVKFERAGEYFSLVLIPVLVTKEAGIWRDGYQSEYLSKRMAIKANYSQSELAKWISIRWAGMIVNYDLSEFEKREFFFLKGWRLISGTSGKCRKPHSLTRLRH